MKLLNVEYDNLTIKEAVLNAVDLSKKGTKESIFFLNADCMYQASKDNEYNHLLKDASLVLPDGVGVRFATALFGGKMRENCNGTDFSPLFIRELAKEGKSIFLFGGREGVAARAAEALQNKYPNLRIVGTSPGYPDNDAKVIEQINTSGADVLFVALGVPLQEKWISKHRQNLKPTLCLGVGALLDFLSGSKPRAPRFFRAISCEWLWRLFVEPRRMFKRYIIHDTAFLFYLIFYRFRNFFSNRATP